MPGMWPAGKAVMISPDVTVATSLLLRSMRPPVKLGSLIVQGFVSESDGTRYGPLNTRVNVLVCIRAEQWQLLPSSVHRASTAAQTYALAPIVSETISASANHAPRMPTPA